MIKYAENIHPIFSRTRHETFNYVVGIMAVAQKVLSTQQHLLWGIRHNFSAGEYDPTGLHRDNEYRRQGCATPGFQRPKTDFVGIFLRWAAYRQRRMRVARKIGERPEEYDVGDTQRFCLLS